MVDFNTAHDQPAIEGTIPGITSEQMDAGEAREITNQIKGKADELWYMLLAAYERGAHTALGYPSWGAYFEAEFGGSGKRGDQLLRAGRVVRAIEKHAQDTNVSRPNEAQARELAPLAKAQPEEAAKVWDELVEEHGDQLTATDVKQAATERVEFKERLAALPEQTRAVLEQADESFDKHRNLLRNSNQMNHLARIADKRGDEVAAEVAERALTHERSNIFKAYEEVKVRRGIEEPPSVGEALTSAVESGEIIDVPPKQMSDSQAQGYKSVERYYLLSKYDPEEVAKSHERTKDPKRWEEEVERTHRLLNWLDRYLEALTNMEEKAS